jgi:hypothetical protein
MRRTLIIMAKAPEAGRVKTRLGRQIGMGRAAEAFRLLLRATLDEACSREWSTVVAVEPRAGIRAWRHLWPATAHVMPQARGDLGARMSAAMAAVSKGPVIVIGADAPALRRRHLRHAFRALERVDAVFGPADDGGYWLIGLSRKRRAPALFNGVRWSSAHALADTIASLPSDFAVERLEMLRDVDCAEDLAAMTPRSRR